MFSFHWYQLYAYPGFRAWATGSLLWSCHSGRNWESTFTSFYTAEVIRSLRVRPKWHHIFSALILTYGALVKISALHTEHGASWDIFKESTNTCCCHCHRKYALMMKSIGFERSGEGMLWCCNTIIRVTRFNCHFYHLCLCHVFVNWFPVLYFVWIQFVLGFWAFSFPPELDLRCCI